MTSEVVLRSAGFSVVWPGTSSPATLFNHQVLVSASLGFSKKSSLYSRVFPTFFCCSSAKDSETLYLLLVLFLMSCLSVLYYAKLPSGHNETLPASQTRSRFSDAHWSHWSLIKQVNSHPLDTIWKEGHCHFRQSQRCLMIPNLNLVPMSWRESWGEVNA